MADLYGKSWAEFTDLFKDVSYAQTVQHESYKISLLIWIFSLFVFIFTVSSVLLMSQKMYKDAFTDRDFKLNKIKKNNHFGFFWLKLKRALREALQLQDVHEKTTHKECQ